MTQSPKVREALAELFTRARIADVNLSQLSRESGLSRVTLSNWRHGKASPALDAYLDVIDAMGRLEVARAAA